MTPYHESDGVTLYHGDCLQALRTLPAESVDAVVSDPPYGLSFMGKRWDYDVPATEVWAECLRVLKPGGHLLAFAGTRTQHRMAVRIEDAGFEIRDMIAWVYGSGFPKSLDVSKAIDRMDASEEQERRRLRFTAWVRGTGVTSRQIDEATGTNMGGHYTTAASQPAIMTREHLEACRHLLGDVPEWVEREADIRSVESENMKSREVVGRKEMTDTTKARAGFAGSAHSPDYDGSKRLVDITAPATPEAQRWQGWGTALKPSWECITVARKPLSGTVAETVLQYGTGALNVDGCRVGTEIVGWGGAGGESGAWNKDTCGLRNAGDPRPVSSRWPANLIHDGSDEVTGLFPETTSHDTTGIWSGGMKQKHQGNAYGVFTKVPPSERRPGRADTGSAARFFYCAKASKRDRGESNRHPTVKPTALMRYLCKLITPPGGLVLDPFTGSGSTGRGAVLEGFRFVGMELDAEHVAEAKRRILEVQNGWTDEPEDEPVEDLPGQRLLF